MRNTRTTRSIPLGNVTVAAPNDRFRRLVSHASISFGTRKLAIRGGA